jgi:hypothetical protein
MCEDRSLRSEYLRVPAGKNEPSRLLNSTANGDLVMQNNAQ